MAFIRNKIKERFTIVNNLAINDDRLSLKTLGLYVKLVSLPDDWHFSEKGLDAIFNDGLSSIRSGLKDLEKYGYLKRTVIRDPKTGQYVNKQWEIFEISTFSPGCDFPPLDNPPLDNHTEYNTNRPNTKEQNNYIQQVDAFKKAYKDYYNEPHRDSVGLYHNICGYDPDEIYDLALEHFTKSTKQQSTIDYFETVIDRYR